MEAGSLSLFHERGTQLEVTGPQNHAVKDYLTILHYAGTSANLETLVLSANRVLFYSGATGTVSRRWGKRWMVRHAEFLKILKTKPMHIKRLAAHVVEDINNHFTDFCWCKDKWSIYDDNMSNFDESGFPIGVTTSEQVIIPVDCTVVYQADPANRELVTTIKTLNYNGKKVPSIIIFSSAYQLQKHFNNDIDGDILFARLASGYSNNKIGLIYFKHFNLFTESSTKGSYCM